MGQRKYLIFSTGGRCQWLMKRWNRFSLFFKIISLSISSSEMIFYQVVRIPTFRWITCYKWSGHQDLRRRCSEIMIFRSARTSCRTFDFSTRPVPSTRPQQFFLCWWKLMMSAIQIRTKMQIQRQIQRQRQIKGSPMTPMMWYIFEKEMTKGFWIWYATGRV